MITPTRPQFKFTTIPPFMRLAIVSFFMALAYSLIGTVWSIYIKEFVGSDAIVGLITSFLSLISLLSYIFSIPLIEKYDKSKIYRTTLIATAVLYAILSVNKVFVVFLFLAAIITCLSTLRINSMGILIKENTKKKDLSRGEGLIYTFLNTAWLFGPLVAGALLVIVSTNTIFLIASSIFLLTLVLFLIARVKGNKTIEDPTYTHWGNAIGFFKDRDRVIAYILGGGVNFWWMLVYTFMPLYVISRGLSEQYIGYFLFAVAVPLILLEYPFSKLIGRVKYRTLFKLGYFIAFISALIAFFAQNIYLVFGMMVMASVGLAMIEPTTESYFLRLMTHREELKYYGIYSTTIDINLLVASLISSAFLFFFPFKALFLLFSLFMAFFFLLSSKARGFS